MIETLAQKIERKKKDLDHWYQQHLSDKPDLVPPIYSSADIRNAGFKVSVVDTNLFPAGFNNLCETFSEKGAEAFKDYFHRWYPNVGKILIFPEEHTRNIFYWKSIAALSQMLHEAGMEVKIGSASTLFTSDPFSIEISTTKSIEVNKVFLKDQILQTTHFVPDLILINNDLSTGIPDYLKGLKQLLLPSPRLGWHRRKKSDHFYLYKKLIQEVASILDVDPWILSPLSAVETGVDLDDEICLKRLQTSADHLLAQMREKYIQYGISREPYLFVKNDSGTYGLGITHIQSGEQLLKLNRRLKNKLQSAKGGQNVSAYLLQEGIPTADLLNGKPLEPVVYLVGGEAIGTFFRIHEEKDEFENLNQPGMSFGCICLHKVEGPKKSYQLTYDNKEHLFTVTALLGKVASLASALELK